MYRIVFDTKSAAWKVQLQKAWFFWSTIKIEPFPDHASAKAYVDRVGIAKAYRDFNDTDVRWSLPCGPRWEAYRINSNRVV